MKHDCPHCGASLWSGASFCPYCARGIRPRQEVDVPVRRWVGPLKRALRLLILAALAAAAVLLYDATTPDVYNASGELIYHLNGQDYRLLLTFRNLPTPEAERTMPVEADGFYERASKLFIFHQDSGTDAGQMFYQHTQSVQVRVFQPPDNPSPVICQPPIRGEELSEGLLVSSLEFTGQSWGPVEMEWTITMKNGDTIFLWQTLNLQPVDSLHCYPEDYDMDTIEDLQALVDRLQEEIPLPTVIHLHLPPVQYQGGLTIDRRAIQLSGSTDEQGRRTSFLGPVVLSPEQNSLTSVQNIDFQGNGSGTGLTIEADYRVKDCRFTGWDVGMLIGGENWADPIDCWFEDNGVGLRFDSAGTYFNYTDFTGNTFVNNGIGMDLVRVPSNHTIRLAQSRFSGNEEDILNATDNILSTVHVIFE